MIDKEARQYGPLAQAALNHERNISKYDPLQSTRPIRILPQAEYEDFRAFQD
jgi:hypothetical protein